MPKVYTYIQPKNKTESVNDPNSHIHENKDSLDKITDSKINSWDSKANANHNHDAKYSPISHNHDNSVIDNSIALLNEESKINKDGLSSLTSLVDGLLKRITSLESNNL